MVPVFSVSSNEISRDPLVQLKVPLFTMEVTVGDATFPTVNIGASPLS